MANGYLCQETASGEQETDGMAGIELALREESHEAISDD